jgi:hypothetical protein
MMAGFAETMRLVFADPAAAPFAAMLVLACAPNIVFRVAGVFLSRGLDEGSELLAFVRAMATALLAGVVGKLLTSPPGALAQISGGARLAAFALAIAAFFACRRSLLAALATGEAALIAAFLLR